MTDFIFALYICSWATCGDEPLSTHKTLQECLEMREEANKALAGGQFSICKRVGQEKFPVTNSKMVPGTFMRTALAQERGESDEITEGH